MSKNNNDNKCCIGTTAADANNGTGTGPVNNNYVHDYVNVFPSSKIKSILRQEKDIGRIYTSAVGLIGASSAMFIQNLVHDSLITASSKYTCNINNSNNISSGACSECNNTRTVTITANDIQNCIQQNSAKYDFLQHFVESDDNNNEQEIYNHIDDDKNNIKNNNCSNYNSCKKKNVKRQQGRIPNYSKIQNQIETSAIPSNNKSDSKPQGIDDTEKKKRPQSSSTTDQIDDKKKLKYLPVTNDNVIDRYLKSQEFQANGNSYNNSHHASTGVCLRFGEDRIIEDEEDYDI